MNNSIDTGNISQYVPEYMKARKCWLLWKLTEYKGKLTKIPWSANGGSGSSTDGKTWCTYEKTIKKLHSSKGGYDGIGYAIEESSGVVFVDIDHCISEDGTLSDAALDILNAFDNKTYVEVSQSGTGLHILSIGKLPVKANGKPASFKNKTVEVYAWGRYVAFTGNALIRSDLTECQQAIDYVYGKYNSKVKQTQESSMPAAAASGYPKTLQELSDAEVIAKICSSRKGQDLFSGRYEDYYPSHSEADQGLCDNIAFWTDKDAAAIDRIFRASGLYREKWEREDYSHDTIQNAIVFISETYSEYRERMSQETGVPVNEVRDPSADDVIADRKNSSRGFRGFKFQEEIENKNSMTGPFDPIEPFKEADAIELPEFNLEWLPDGLFRRYARAICNNLQVSSDMVAPALITAVSAAIQKKITICLKPGYYEPVNLYMAVIASPSERKSPTQKEIVFPFYSYEKEENMRREPLITEYRNKKKALKKLMDKTINKCVGKENADEQISSIQTQIDSLEEVTPIRLIASDITAEKLASVMKANNETLSIFDTEGGIFLIMAGLYSSKGMGSNIDIYLKSFSNDNVSIDRKNADSVVMYHPSLAMLLFVQPQVIKQIMSNREFSGRGLLARFGYVFPKSLVGGRKFYTDPIDKELRRSYEKAMHNLIQLDPQCDGFPSRTIHPCLESMSIINQYFDEVEGKLKTQYQPIESWAGKCFGQSARIAACLHAMKYQQNCVNREIDTETISSAISIEKYLTEHVAYAFSAMGIQRSIREETALYILKKLKQIISLEPKTPKTLKTPKTDFITVDHQTLYQECRGRYDTSAKLNRGLNELVMRNYIRVKEIPSGEQGGRPKKIIEVNPDFMNAIPEDAAE